MQINSAFANQALSGQVQSFLLKKQRKRPATSEQYAFVLERVLLPWCSAQGIADAAELTSLQMERFIEYLEHRQNNGKPLAIATVRTYVRAVRIFLKWAGVPAGDYEIPKEPGRLRNVLSREEVGRLERSASTERDRLLVRVLADSGIRLGELLGLRPIDLREDAHSRRYFIRVIGKGDKEREVGLPHETFYRLKRLAGDHERVFDRLTKSGAEQVVRRLAVRAKIGRRVFPHLFRHSYVTQMARKQVPMLDVAKALGHSSLAMVSQVYSHITADDSYDVLMAGLKG